VYATGDCAEGPCRITQRSFELGRVDARLQERGQCRDIERFGVDAKCRIPRPLVARSYIAAAVDQLERPAVVFGEFVVEYRCAEELRQFAGSATLVERYDRAPAVARLEHDAAHAGAVHSARDIARRCCANVEAVAELAHPARAGIKPPRTACA
jgi:hypothetical protein